MTLTGMSLNERSAILICPSATVLLVQLEEIICLEGDRFHVQLNVDEGGKYIGETNNNVG